MDDPVHALAIRLLRVGEASQLDAGLVGFALLAAAGYVAHHLGHDDRDAFCRMAGDAFDAGNLAQKERVANDD